MNFIVEWLTIVLKLVLEILFLLVRWAFYSVLVFAIVLLCLLPIYLASIKSVIFILLYLIYIVIILLLENIVSREEK